MGRLKSVDVNEIIERGNIREGDVLSLRRAFYDDGVIEPSEAKLLFDIHDACNVQDEGWADFFVEAVTDYCVRQAEPEGYVTVENADWLIEAICRDGHITTKTELEALISVIETARWSPPRLAAFALDQVKHAVLKGDGPLRTGGKLEPGVIQEGEVDLLRRMIYGFGGDGSVGVTSAEAKVLFEIDEALGDDAFNAAWTELFVKAIANVVMGASGYQVPSREEALRVEAWLDERGDLSPFELASKVAQEGLSGVISSYFGQSKEDRAIARLERQRLEIVTGEQITDDEVQWLCDRLGGNGTLSPNEAALIEFLREHAPTLDARLEELVERLAKAA